MTNSTLETTSQHFSPASAKLAAEIEHALRYGREYDWIGHHVATILAMLYLFLIPLATAPKEWAFALLAIWTVIRIPHTWRSYGALMFMPVVWVATLWMLWLFAGLMWSSDIEQGLGELKVLRVLAIPLLLWPILDRLPWLVLAALAGVLAQNGVQVLQEIGWISSPDSGEGRLRGLIHPIHSAMWFSAALLWHLSATCSTRGAWRWASVVLMASSLIGLIATGSRGPWIAMAVALPLMMGVVAVRRSHSRMPMLIVAAMAFVGIAGIWLTSPALIRDRLDDARQEITNAREHQVYWTSTGLRLALWGWAWEVWKTSPIVGVGAGDFPSEYPELASFKAAAAIAREQSLIEEVPGYAEAKAAGQDVTKLRFYRRGERHAANRLDYLLRGHAHSTYLQTLAAQGLIGLVLLAIMLGVIARQCWRDRTDHPYSDAMLFVLVCWVVGAQFDCYELNGHQLSLLALIATFTMPGRAAVRWKWSAVDDDEHAPNDGRNDHFETRPFSSPFSDERGGLRLGRGE